MKKVLIGTLLSVVAVIAFSVYFLLSSKFTAEKFEVGVKATDKSMQSTWAMVENNLNMQGFTVKNYGETFINSIKAQAERYANDRNGMMKWVQENRAGMTAETHTKFMNAIEKGYAQKDARQQGKISYVQEYETYLNASLKGMIAKGFFNYPTVPTKDIMDRIISSKQTKETWKTGNDESGSKNPFK